MSDVPLNLPVLVPSSAATENAGRAFGISVDPSLRDKWSEAPGWARHHYNKAALAMLHAAGPHLIADVLAYAVTNHKEFGFSAHTVDQLIDASVAATSAAAASHQGSLPGVL